MELKKTYSYIISSNVIGNSLLDVGEIIAKKGLNTTRKDCLNVLNSYGIKSLEDFKGKFIKLILLYIKVALKDNIITDEEIKNIRFLKLLFNIEEGDFTKEKIISNEVSRIIRTQIYLMHQDDNKIDSQEALQKVNLQEIFGLSYDEFLSLNNDAAIEALEKGADLLDIDTFITIKEFDQWSKQNELGYEKENDNELNKRSRSITEDVKDSVWNRDGGKCIQCGDNENLEFDHIIPFSEGGSNTKRNIQLLCQPCNRKKSNKIG